MATSKEFYLDFSREETKTFSYDFARGTPYDRRQTLTTEVSLRGISLSLPHHIIFGTIEGSAMFLTITTTRSDYPEAFTTKHEIYLSDVVLDSVSTLRTTDDQFSIVAFVSNGEVRECIFNLKHKQVAFTSCSYNFNTQLDVIVVEYLNFSDSRVFALGSLNGSVYIVKLPNQTDDGRTVEYLTEVKQKSLTNKLASFFYSQSPDSITAIKYLGNNLLCYVTQKFQFKIWSCSLKTEVYSGFLIKNRTDELLNNGKIIFNSIPFDEREINQVRSKCFNFLIYMEYNSAYVLSVFDVWFMNIPEHNLNNVTGQRNFKSFYDFIELGNDIRFKNNRIFHLDGRLVDFIVFQDKFYTMTEAIKADDAQSLIPHEIKIFGADSSSITWNLLENKKIYLDYFIKLVRSGANNKQTQKDLIVHLMMNKEHFNENLLQVYFRNKNKFEFSSGNNEIFQMLMKLERKELIVILEDLTTFLLDSEMISFTPITNKEIEGLGIVRKNGLSLISHKQAGWEYTYERVSVIENTIRNMIRLDKIQIGRIDELESLQGNIARYIYSQIRENESNALPILLAYLRIYLTECYLIIEDEAYVMDYLQSHSIDELIQLKLETFISHQFSNLTFFDVLNELIQNMYFNYKSTIDNAVIDLYTNIHSYLNENILSDQLRDLIHAGEELFVGDIPPQSTLHPKLCELIASLSKNKIRGLFHTARDLLSFSFWSQNNNESFRKLFKQNYASFILSNHYIGNKSYLLISILSNIQLYGLRKFEQAKEEYIDIISLLMFRKDVKILKSLLLMKQYKLILTLIQIENRDDLLFLQVLCHAYLNQQEQMKESLTLLYLKLNSTTEAQSCVKTIQDFSGEASTEEERKVLSPNLTLTTYKFLERKIEEMCNDKLLHVFYAHSYSLIHIDSNDHFAELLVPIAKSFMKYDPYEGIALYLAIKRRIFSIKEETRRSILHDNLVEIFLNQILSNYDLKFITKLLPQQQLIQQICDKLTKTCEAYDGITIKNIILSTKVTNKRINPFVILYQILRYVKNYELASKVYYKYYNAITVAINLDGFQNKETYLCLLYEQRTVLDHICNHMILSPDGNNQFEHLNIDGEIVFLKLNDIKKLQSISAARIALVERSKEVNMILTTQEILLKRIFTERMYDIVTQYNLVCAVEERIGRILIVNFMKMEFATKEHQQLLIKQIIQGGNLSYMWVLMEMLMTKNEENPTKLKEKLLSVNPHRYMELLLKYGRKEVEELFIFRMLRKF